MGALPPVPVGGLDSLTYYGKVPIMFDTGIVLPTYRIYRFKGSIYKLVKFKRSAPYVYHGQKKTSEPKHEVKLDSSISRTKRLVLEKALCNEWEYFCTFTLSKEKYDRYQLDKFHKDLTQWIRDQRKKGLEIKYLLVPELHKDGAWHMHGLMSGVGSQLVSFKDERRKGRKVPSVLVNNGFYDYPAYRKKFGFCSLAHVRSSVAVSFYVLKYISKDISESSVAVGKHSYFSSRPLNHSTLHSEVYCHSAYLDSFLENDYQFCRTGMTKMKDNLDWTFGLEYVDFEPLTPSDEMQETQEIEKYCNTVHDVFQLSFPL